MAIQPLSGSVNDARNIVVDTGTFLLKFFGNDWQKFATKYNFALKEYFDAKLGSLSKVKPTFATEVVELEKIYVEQFVYFNGDIHHQDKILDLIQTNKKIVISATAGAGKSSLVKHFFINIIRKQKSFFPLFLELRKTNNNSNSLIENICDDIKIFNKSFSIANLEFILKRENTILFLDGFDEINYENKKKYITELNLIADQYPNLKIIITSRPEYGLFQQWSLFSVINIEPLTIHQAEELVKKLHYDVSIKERFINYLKIELFQKQNDFAKNPLLLIIMMLTYGQYGEIPQKKHIFYDLAYQTLFNKHDNSKQGYSRKRLTNLDIREFQLVFSLFSLISYCKQAYIFSEENLELWLQNSLKFFEKHEVKPVDLKNDLLVNIPLIMQDGLEFCFTHRSFQEYFSAYYLVNSSDISNDIFSQACTNFFSDNVVKMAFSMNKKIIEDKWIIPKLEKIIENVKSFDSDENKFDNLRLFFDEVCLTGNEEKPYEISVIYGENQYFLSFLLDLYCLREYEESLITKYFSDISVTYEEIDLFELVLQNIQRLKFDEANQDEKMLIIRAKKHRHAMRSVELIHEIRRVITASRVNSKSVLEDLILN